jgi:outer membrane protein assembly factor BamD
MALLVLALALIGAPGCGSSSTADEGFGAYKENLKQKYVDGMDALASANYPQAKKLFRELSGESRYVKYSVLAKLRLGDTMLAEGDYEAAEYIYDEFLQQYKGDPNEPYAHFRKCQTREEQVPGDWLILPPPESKDMTHARRAYVCFKDFISLYADSRFAPRAEGSYTTLRGLLYRHERYVADYYWRHDHYDAVVGRVIGIQEDYPEEMDEDLYDRLVRSLAESKDLTRATRYYTDYTSRFPEGRYRGSLQTILDDLKREVPNGSEQSKDPQPAG